jgi:hypothetical protein
MADLLNLAILVAASAGSMIFGLLAAFAVLRAGFWMMRPPQRPTAASVRPQVAQAS